MNIPRPPKRTIGTGTIWSIIKCQAPIYPVYIRDANGNIMTDNTGRQVYDFANSQLGDLSRAGAPAATRSSPTSTVSQKPPETHS